MVLFAGRSSSSGTGSRSSSWCSSSCRRSRSESSPRSSSGPAGRDRHVGEARPDVGGRDSRLGAAVARLRCGDPEAAGRPRGAGHRSRVRLHAARAAIAPVLFHVVAVSGTSSPPRLERHYTIGSSGATVYEQRPRGASWRRTAGARSRSSAPSRTSGAANGARPGASRCTSPRFPVSSPAVRRSPCSTAPVRLTFEPVPEEYVLAYFDSLRPVDKDDVEFKLAGAGIS